MPFTFIHNPNYQQAVPDRGCSSSLPLSCLCGPPLSSLLVAAAAAALEGPLSLERAQEVRGVLVLAHLLGELRPLAVAAGGGGGHLLDGADGQHGAQAALDQVQRAVGLGARGSSSA